MSNDPQYSLVARHAARVLASSELDEHVHARCLQFMHNCMLPAKLAVGEALETFMEKLPRSNAERDAFRRAYRLQREGFIAELASAGETSGFAIDAEARAAALVRALSLPESAAKIIAVSALHDASHVFSAFCDALVGGPTSLTRFMGALTGLSAGEVDFLAGKRGVMTQVGVMRFDGEQSDVSGRYGRYQLVPTVSEALQHDCSSDEQLIENILGKPLASQLEPTDFEHVSRHLDSASLVLRQAATQKIEGINILFYGPPGTGKTELAMMVARAAGVRLYAAGEDSGSFVEQDRSARIASLVLTSALAGRLENAAVFFDEFEDISADLFKRGGSKVFVNRLLERNRAPVIWATNNARCIDPAFIRRMTYVAEIEEMRPRQRREIFQRILRSGKLAISPSAVDSIASRYEVPVSAMRNAALATRLAHGNEAMLEQAVKDQATALGCRVNRQQATHSEFDAELTLASTDLAVLTRDLKVSGQLDISLCLFGPPGTGKSAFARHLARELNMAVVEKRSSDLLGCYVGETEKAIRRAFEEALDQNAMLIFDEADSLLFDRQSAQRNWEVSQVNEMLVALERHPLPFCCTTNRIDGLDSAALRRFALRIGFDFLNVGQVKLAWTQFFPQADYQPSVALLCNLTPGDFAQVRRALRLRGNTSDPAVIAELLQEASAAKPVNGNRIGFRLPA